MIPGSKLGTYEIVAPIGAGGMGEVYRARDTRLNRDVAIKVLPPAFALDPERIARFEREAQVLASLNHPHIAQVHGIVDDPAALVMELVSGEDLSERISRGAIPVRETLALAVQIADALAAAHDRGIVHRDLKPANVKVTDEGVVKVLDFGLAKALEPSPSSTPLVDSPTITSPAAMTRMGMILGTAAYMSPEQARGKLVDRSADLWAFGAVVFEMLTGKPAFEGETVTDVLAAIVMRDPDWDALPKDTPSSIKRLLRRCLDRDRRRRLADAAEARFQIEEALAAPPAAAEAAAVSTRAVTRGSWLPWVLSAVLAIALAVVAWQRTTAPALSMTHVSIEAPRRAILSLVLRPALSISSDGRAVAFIATSDGARGLYVRTADQFEARVLDGTDGASNPDISPDGRWIAFVSGNKLVKMPIGGGPRTELAEVSDARGISWDQDDSILVTTNSVGGVVRIPSGGGPPEALTTPVAGKERTHRWAQMLPGGKAIIFTVGDFNNPDSYVGARIDAQVLATGERKTLVAGAEMARYAASGHLVFARGGSLFAVPFDVDTLTAGQLPEAVLQEVAGDSTTGAVHFDMSRAGTLAYIPASGEQSLTRPAWVDKAGQVEFLAVPPGIYLEPQISPDGKRIALSVIAGGGRAIWIYHVDRKTFTPATFGGQSVTPMWSADGAWIYYASLEPASSSSTIWRRAADGSREPEALVSLPHRVYLNGISADGRTATFDYSSSSSRGSDIAIVKLEKDAKPQALLSGAADEYGSRVSPDGRWLAYESAASGRAEIYVRPADPASSGRWQVSTAGGLEPKWARDGRTLYFRFDNELRAASVEPGEAFQSGLPAVVISNVYDPRIQSGVSYDVHPGGRFLMIRSADEEAVSNTMRLILNWFDELKRVGSRR